MFHGTHLYIISCILQSEFIEKYQFDTVTCADNVTIISLNRLVLYRNIIVKITLLKNLYTVSEFAALKYIVPTPKHSDWF